MSLYPEPARLETVHFYAALECRGVWLRDDGDETHEVGADHTIVIPPNVPHGFTAVGDAPARIIGFFPAQDPFARTHFLEGGPPGNPVERES